MNLEWEKEPCVSSQAGARNKYVQHLFITNIFYNRNTFKSMINQSVLRHIFKESGRGTNLLQFAEIQILDNEACIVPYNDMTRQELFHSENMICAGTEKVNSPYS